MCGVLLYLSVAPAGAQTQKLNEISHLDQALLQVSESELAEPFKTELGVVLQAERLGDFVRFTAKLDSVVTRSQWYDVTRRNPPVVYGTADKRFHEVDSRVLVKLINPERLETIAKDVNAIRSKQYPGLGYSILWLRSEESPIDVVKKLQSDQRVKHAEIQLKRPLMIPL